MLVLKILGILIGIILLLVAVILSLRIDIIIRNNDEKGVQVLYRLIGKVFGEHPDPNNPIAKALKELVGVSHLESKERLQSTVEDSGFAATVSGTVMTLKLLLDRIFWLLPRAKVRKLHLVSVTAGEDAADTALSYGAVCAVLYPLLSYLQSFMRVRKKAVNTQISCNFEAAKSTFELDVEISFSVLVALRALWYIAKEQAVNELEKSQHNLSEVPNESK